MRSGDVVGGRFRIERLAGSGGMGSVWKALDQQTGEPVALKLLHGRDPGDAGRFLREGHLIAGLRHPRIVRYVADGQISDTERFLVMEWLDGESLSDRIGRVPLSLADTLTLARLTAEALGAMHAHGVVHRDLKPSNLFLEGRDPSRVKVIDFGIARLSLGPDFTRTGVLLGTPGYIAPEQAMGEPNIDGRADLFALGCVLFKCLTGKGAFGDDDDLTVLLRVAKGTARRVREVAPRIPAEIDELVGRLLQRVPNDRPPDALVAAAELARLEMIYGAGRPGDDPLDELLTTQNRAVDFQTEDPVLATTNPFPLMVSKARSAAPRAAPAGDPGEDDELELITGIEVDTDPTGRGPSFAARVAAALAEAEEQAAARPPPRPIAPPPPPPPRPAMQSSASIARPPPPPRPITQPTPPFARPPTNPTPPPFARPATQPNAGASKPPPPFARPPTNPTPPPLTTSPYLGAGLTLTTPPPLAPDDAPDRRAEALLRSAEAALQKNDFRAALGHVEQALEAGARGELYGALRARQAEAHRWRGELLEAERASSDAMSALPPGGEMWWLAAREAMLAVGSRSDAARVGALAEEMMRLLPALRPDATNVGTLAGMASYLMHTGHRALLERFLRWVAPLLMVAAMEPPAVAARLFQIAAVRAIHEGNTGGYLNACEAAAERFAAAEDARGALTQRVNACFGRIELGAYARAESDLRAALAGAERLGLNHVALAARANLGVALSKRGALAEARALMLEVLKGSMNEGDRRFEASARTHLSLILLASGDTPGAVREAKGAVEMTPPSSPARLFALAAFARAQLAHDRPMAALEAAELAMEMLETMGGVEEGESLVRLTFAQARQRIGDIEGAADAISTARERLEARAQLITDPALRESFLHEVDENAETVRMALRWQSEAAAWQP